MIVQSNAGLQAGYPDSQYIEKGAQVVEDRAALFGKADIVIQVLCYGSNDVTGKDDLPLLHEDQILIGFLRPFGSKEVIQEIAGRGVTSFSVELMPRTTRAQSMDALSSMGTICGYKAVLIAADTHPRIFPMLTTAAGTITPARVFVIGAGWPDSRPLLRRGDWARSPPLMICVPQRKSRCRAWGDVSSNCPSKPRTHRTHAVMPVRKMRASTSNSGNFWVAW